MLNWTVTVNQVLIYSCILARSYHCCQLKEGKMNEGSVSKCYYFLVCSGAKEDKENKENC